MLHVDLHSASHTESMSGKLKMALVLYSFFEQAQKNVFLEEKVQVLQQQNEDMKARIDMNLSLSR